MMRIFDNMKILNKAITGYSIVLILSAALGILSLMQLHSLGAMTNIVTGNIETMTDLGAMRGDGAGIAGLAAIGLASANASDSLDEFHALVAEQDRMRRDFAQDWQNYAPSIDPGEEAGYAKQIKARFDQLSALTKQFANAVTTGDMTTASSLILGPIRKTYFAFQAAVSGDLGYNLRESEELQRQADSLESSSVKLSLSVFGILVLAIITCVALTIINVARPITQLTALMERLAHRETDIAVIGVGRRDEIGAMATAVQVFKENAIERAQLEIQSAHFHEDLDRRLKETEEAFTETGREQKAVVEGISAALAKLAGGDLTVRFAAVVSGVYEALKNDFNSA
ncbi:MAG TPA: MCP four helix bundle domain-containing protein, partial [Acidisoma sp.]|nr:MCP four helix bundle domain-containing protein [Acidisoma sp.]